MNKAAAALAALSLLAAAPATAQAPRAPAPEPDSEQVEGSAVRGGVYWLLPVLVIVALLTGILAGGDEPASP